MELGLISGFALGSLLILGSNGTLAKHRTMRKLFSFDYATITITGPDDSPLRSWDEYDASIITEASYTYDRSLWVTTYPKSLDNLYLGPIFVVGTYIFKMSGAEKWRVYLKLTKISENESNESKFYSLCLTYGLSFVRKQYIPLISYIVSGEPADILQMTNENTDVIDRFRRLDEDDIILKKVH